MTMTMTPKIKIETGCCADCCRPGFFADTPAGEICGPGFTLVFPAAADVEGMLVLCCSAYGDREPVCDECELGRTQEWFGAAVEQAIVTCGGIVTCACGKQPAGTHSCDTYGAW